MTEFQQIDRRQFAKKIVAASSAVAVASSTPAFSIADDKPEKEPKKEEQPERPAAPSEELLLLNCLMQRYPSEHFDEAAIRGIYGDIRGDVARGRVLSEFPLKNSDEPCFVFRAYRGPE